MTGYAKLFSSIVTSSIWGEDDQTRLVWITMLAIADKHGEVHASVPGLARVAVVPVEACERAIEKLMAPDKHSRTRDDDGRRIEAIDGGWVLLNYQKYRRMASVEDERDKTAERVRRHRERQKRNVTQCNAPVTQGNDLLTLETDNAEAEAKAESKVPPVGKRKRASPVAVESTLGNIQWEFCELWADAFAEAMGNPYPFTAGRKRELKEARQLCIAANCSPKTLVEIAATAWEKLPNGYLRRQSLTIGGFKMEFVAIRDAVAGKQEKRSGGEREGFLSQFVVRPETKKEDQQNEKTDHT